MKLSDLLFETNILLEDETFVVRKTPDGRRWAVYNTTSGSPVFISGHKAKSGAERAAERLRNPVPPTPRNDNAPSDDNRRRRRGGNRTPAATPEPDAANVGNETSQKNIRQGLVQRGNKWTLVLPDGKTIIENITNEADAERLNARMIEMQGQNKTPEQITREFKNPSRLAALGITGQPRATEFSIKRNIANYNLNEAIAKVGVRNGRVAQWFTTARGPMRAIGAIGGSRVAAMFAIFYGMMVAIDEIDAEMEELPPGSDKLNELQREAEIIAGQAYLTLTSIILTFFLSFNRLRALVRVLKNTVRGAAVAAGAATGSIVPGAGTVAGAVAGFALTEIASAGLLIILSQPSTHRWFAKYITDTIFGDAFQFVGSNANAALQKVAAITGGAYGTGFLLRSFSTEAMQSGGVEGEYYSDSEWAKLVFGGLMFGEGEDSKLVPYITPSRREQLLNETLGISETPEVNSPQAAPGANPETSSEPGMPVNPDAQAGPQ